MFAVLLTLCICATVTIAMLAQAFASVNEADARAARSTRTL
jgi:hypothetical protein